MHRVMYLTLHCIYYVSGASLSILPVLILIAIQGYSRCYNLPLITGEETEAQMSSDLPKIPYR